MPVKGMPFFFKKLGDILNKILNGLRKPISRNSNMNILAFVFFLVLSTIFWLLLAINKIYVETISFPLKFENFPERRVQVGDLPNRLYLTVETSGIEILKHKIRSTINPININMVECSIFPLSKKDSSKFYVLTNLERQQIASQFKSEMRIMEINPDTLYFQFDFLKIKEVPIEANVEIICEQQYMLVGKPSFEVDSATARGPSSIIDTLQAIYTKKEILENVESPVNKNIQLVRIPGVSLAKIPKTDIDKWKVRIIADVDKFTETKTTVPVIPKNVPDTLKLKTFPRTVSISYHIPLKLFETVSAEDFQMTVDYNLINPVTADKLKLTLDRKPDNVVILGWQPKNVEYILEK